MSLRRFKRQRLLDYDSDNCSAVIGDATINNIESDLKVLKDKEEDFKERKKRFQKTDDDAVPLPDPFPLPKNYKADVEVALKNGKMTIETKKRFFSAVAAAMFTYKKYPKPEDYQNVARCIINKYPFFKSPVGSPHVSLLILLIKN